MTINLETDYIPTSGLVLSKYIKNGFTLLKGLLLNAFSFCVWWKHRKYEVALDDIKFHSGAPSAEFSECDSILAKTIRLETDFVPVKVVSDVLKVWKKWFVYKFGDILEFTESRPSSCVAVLSSYCEDRAERLRQRRTGFICCPEVCLSDLVDSETPVITGGLTRCVWSADIPILLLKWSVMYGL